MSDKNKKILAIDVSDNTIEIVESCLLDGKLKISSMNRVCLKAGIVENGEIKNEEELKKEISILLTQAKPEAITAKQAIFSLPDSLIYSHLFEVERVEETSFDLEKSADQVIPIDKADRMLSDKQFILNEKKYCLLLATSRRAVGAWQKFFSSIDINLDKIEFGPIAAYYGVKQGKTIGITCLLDIGANTSSVSFFSTEGLIYFFNMYVAGNSISKKIALDKKITIAKAEKLKIDTDISQINNEIASSIGVSFDEIFKNLEKNIDYLQGLFRTPVDQVVLLGGGAKQKGINKYLENLKFTVPIKLAKSSYIDNEKLEYINVLGLSALNDDSNKEIERRISLMNDRKAKKHQQEEITNRINDFTAMLIKNKRVLVLLSILMVVIFSGMIFLKIGDSPKKETDLFSLEYPHYLNLPVIIEIDLLKENVFEARRVRVKIEAPVNTDKLIEQGRNLAEAELRTGEIIWTEPLNDLSGKNLVFPIYLEWLIYDHNKARTAVLDEVARLMKETTYVFEDMSIQSLEKESEEGVYRVYALAKVHSALSLEEIEAKKVTQESLVKKEMIQVKDIGTNLNVRQGPGVNFSVVGQALPLGLYEFVKEENGWYQINLNKNTVGWVLGSLVDLNIDSEM